MNPREEGFLLLGSYLGNPERKILTTAQLRTLAQRAAAMERPMADRELELTDLLAMGYGPELGARILALLNEQELLRRYLTRARQADCVPVSRVSDGYPAVLRRRLGLDSPGVLWCKGETSLLQRPGISLVGSRDIRRENADFAAQVGYQAARQGYVLISGNARGADSIAQNACLEAGGEVISVVADDLTGKRGSSRVLYISLEGFDLPFTPARALSRNRVIHALGEETLVAQCSAGMGGTWDGTVRNLRAGWSPVFCFQDGTEAVQQLVQLGAGTVQTEDLADLGALQEDVLRLF